MTEAWYYLVAAFLLTAHGYQAELRAVGPFDTAILCNAALAKENPALWKSQKCFEFGNEDPPDGNPFAGWGRPQP
jgi:hypothetical protein